MGEQLNIGDIVTENYLQAGTLDKQLHSYSWPRSFMLIYKIDETDPPNKNSQIVYVIRTDGIKTRYYNWQLSKILL
jgi:hypothetical protein